MVTVTRSGKTGPPTPFTIAIDLVILTIRLGRLQVLLIERGNEPFKGRRALPGGFVRGEEDLDEAADRELAEETGIGAPHRLEQLKTYGSHGRDPRGRVASVAYLAIAANLPVPEAGTDAANAFWVPVAMAKELAFDHEVILSDAIELARKKLEDSALAIDFCDEPFTIPELRAVYEAVWGIRLDPRNFSRKVASTPNFVEPIGAARRAATGRPAALYRRGGADVLYPPMKRPEARSTRG